MFSQQGGKTPLHHAVMKPYAEVVTALLKAGSKVDEKDEVRLNCVYSMHVLIP